MDGSVQWEQSAKLESQEDTTVSVIDMEYPLGISPVHFIRLELRRGADLVSENCYWRGVEEGNYLALRDLPKVTIESATTVVQDGDRWRLTTELSNPSTAPALMVRVKAVRERGGDRILPALYSDNDAALVPGECRTISTDLSNADARGDRPRIVIEGFNTGEVTYKASPAAAATRPGTTR